MAAPALPSVVEPQQSTVFRRAFIKVQKQSINSISCSPNGRILALAGRSMHFLDLEDVIKTPKTARASNQATAGKDISLVAWSYTNPSSLASSCLQNLTIWDCSAERQTAVSTFQCHRRAIAYFDYSHASHTLIATCSLDSDSYLYLWDIRAPTAAKKHKALRSAGGGATNVKFNRRQEYLIASAHNTQLQIWDIRKEAQPIAIITADTSPLVDLDWSHHDMNILLSCSQAGRCKLWDITKPRQTAGTLPANVSRARFTPFGTGVLALMNGGDHTFELQNVAKPNAPELVSELAPLDQTAIMPSSFTWRVATFPNAPGLMEPQLISYSSTDDIIRLWPISVEDQTKCGGHPSALSAKVAKLVEKEEQERILTNVTSPTSPRSLRRAESAATASGGSELAFGANKSANWDLGDQRKSVDLAASNSSAASSEASLTSPLPSPVSPDKEYVVPGDTNRRKTRTGSLSTAPAPVRQMSLDQEWNYLKRSGPPGITIEKTNKAERSLLITAKHGVHMMQVRITFPSLYPNMAPPSFHLLSNISPHSAVKAKEALVDTAQEYVDKAQNCLDPCLKKLMELLKQESEASGASRAANSALPGASALTSIASLPKLRENSSLPSLSRTPSSGVGPTSPVAAAAASGLAIPEGHTVYMVKQMDSLAAIALACNMTVSSIRKLNNIHHSGQLMPGQLLVVKQNSDSTKSQPSTPLKSSTGAAGPTTPSDSLTSSGYSSAPSTPFQSNKNSKGIREQAMMRSHMKLNLAKDDISLTSSGVWGESGPGISLSAGSTPVSSPKAHPLNQSGQLSPGRRRPQHHISSSDFIGGSATSPIPVGRRSSKPGGIGKTGKFGEIVSPNERKQSVHQMRCKYVDTIATPPGLIGGLLTLTDSQLVFEPDLDDPQVEKLGVTHYTVFLEMGLLVHAEALRADMSLVMMKVDEALLQVLTSEKQAISTSNVILFLGLESKIQEWCKLMQLWISGQKQKNLLQSLNLDSDSFMTKAKSRLGGRSSSPSDSLGYSKLGMSNNLLATNLLGAGQKPGEAKTPASPKAGPAPSTTAQPGGSAATAATPQRPSMKDTITSFIGNVFSGITESGSTQTPAISTPAPEEDENEDEYLPKLLDTPNIMTTEMLRLLAPHLPNRVKDCDWQQLFCTATNGTSLITFYSKCKGVYPTVILIKDSDGYVFGGFASTPWELQKGFFGTGECFLFTLVPHFAVYKWTQADTYFMLAHRDCLAMGGQGSSGRNGFWIDSEFSYGTSEVCKTFLNRRLSQAEEFKAVCCEVWTFVT